MVIFSKMPLRFNVEQISVYAVDELFPKIVASSFVGGSVPSKIDRVSYRVDLSASTPTPVPHAQADAIINGFGRAP
jgi:hypothetical protein